MEDFYNEFYSKLRSQPIHIQSGYQSVEEQHSVYNALLDIINPGSQFILDVGCGVGGLYFFMKNDAKWVKTIENGNYYGIDIHEKAIEISKAKEKSIPTENISLESLYSDLDEYNSSFNPILIDWTILSGLFNHKEGSVNNNDRIITAIQQCLQYSQQGVVVNFLSDWKVNNWEIRNGLIHYSPKFLFELISQNFKKFFLRTDYLSDDVMFYILSSNN